MFEHALLESAKHSPSTQRTVSTAASALLQTSFLAAFIIVPLLATHAVPDFVAQQPPIWLPPLETPTQQIDGSSGAGDPEVFTSAPRLTQPAHIEDLNRHAAEREVAPVRLGGSDSNPANISALFGSGAGPAIPEGPAAKHPVVSVLEQGVVLTRVQPVYPRLAIETRVQGPVHLHAIIASNGTLESLQVLSGHPMLAKAALDAVRQWRFRPYVLNGKPIEVHTEVTVNFTLN